MFVSGMFFQARLIFVSKARAEVSYGLTRKYYTSLKQIPETSTLAHFVNSEVAE
jgi:hypothetical protein